MAPRGYAIGRGGCEEATRSCTACVRGRRRRLRLHSEDTGGGGQRVSLYGANEVGFAEAIAACNKKADGRYRITYVPLPRTADAQRELMARRLAAEDSDIDLVTLDIPWTAEFAEAGWIREWEGERGQKALEGRLDGPVRTVQYEDKVWATPFTTNTQMLFYRKDR